MNLPIPNLDDRKFQDIVDEAKRKIPEHCPEWTNHNVSDPGVALIELFAWMSEMVLYRLNQVPEKMFLHFLNLMGVQPFPAAAATTRLSFFLSAPIDETVVVPAGTSVGTRVSTGSPIVFTTALDLAIVQPELQAALVGTGADVLVPVWDDLRHHRTSVEIFRSDPIAPGDSFYLGFESSLAGNIIELTIEASIEGIGVDPRRPPLVWEAWADDGGSEAEGWVPLAVQEDTTGGLNRDGRVVLLMTETHKPVTMGQSRQFWIRVRLVEPVDGTPNYQRSPQIRTLTARSLGGSVVAEHAEAIGAEMLGVSSGEADQAFLVANHPVLPRTEHEFVQVVGTGEPEDWTEVENFTLSGPRDKHYLWDSATGEIRFGPRVRYPDGSTRQHGMAPPAGDVVRVTGYRHGGGAAGNVGANTLVAIQSSRQFIGRVTNFEAATGGVDAETVDNAKRRGPLTIMTGQRAVTIQDYERLALEATQSLARARCLPPGEDRGPIRLLVVPAVVKRDAELVLDDFRLTDELERRLVEHLEPRRMLGATVKLTTPYYQGVSVAALVRSGAGRSPAVVRQRVLDALYRYINPLHGGADGEGWPFAADLNAADVQQVIAAVDGVERVDQTLFFEVDLRNELRLGAAREIIRLEEDSLFLSSGHQVVVR